MTSNDTNFFHFADDNKNTSVAPIFGLSFVKRFDLNFKFDFCKKRLKSIVMNNAFENFKNF